MQPPVPHVPAADDGAESRIDLFISYRRPDEVSDPV